MPDTTPKPLVFISYARRDGLDAAKHLDASLPGYGFKTWRDERGIDPAKDFTSEIERAIEASQYVVVCITPDVKRDNSFVRREIQYALMLEKPVIVARFADVVPPIHVIDNTWVQCYDRAPTESLEELVTQLRKTPAALPVTTPPPDAFREYVQWLYARMVRFLDQAVIRLIDLDVTTDPDKVAPPPRRRETRDIFDQRYLPFDPGSGDNTGPEPEPDTDAPHFDTFTAAYEHYDGRLLLLGDPGAGKSVTLMAFARDAAAARLDDPTAPLPVFGVVATWDAEQQTPLAAWLAESHADLETRGLARVIEGDGALLLLDGLDELGGERQGREGSERQERAGGKKYDPRQRFLAQIPANGRAVVSCRIEDYEQIEVRAKLAGAITLQPLSDDQIRAYLANDPDLLAAVEADDDLRAMVRTPLIMSLFAFAYRDQSDTGELRDLSASPHTLRKMIFDRYVQSRYRWEQQRSPDPLPFTLEEIYRTLGYLAAWNMLGRSRQVRENVLPLHDFEAVLDRDADRASVFVTFLERLHLLRDNGEDTFRFTHLLLRLHFASVPVLIVFLDHTNYNVRFFAARALGQIGDAGAVPALNSALGDTNKYVRRSAAEALGWIGDPQAVPALVTTLGDADVEVRRRAAEALGQIGDAGAVPALIAALSDSNSDVCRSVADILVQFGDAQAVSGLVAALSDADEWIRINAAAALGRIGDARAVPALITALGDVNRYVRSSAASALVQIGPPSVPALITALADVDENVSIAAVSALGQIGDAGAVPALITALGDAEWQVRRSAARALIQISTPAVPALIIALDDQDDLVRSRAAFTLARIGDARAVPALIAALGDANKWVRRNAADALGQIGDARAVPALVAALGGTHSDGRESAAAALGLIGDPKAVPALISVLGDADWLVRRRAADALGRIGDEGAVPALISVLCDADWDVRESAASALEKIGTPEALAAVAEYRRKYPDD